MSRPPELYSVPQKRTLSVLDIATGKVTPVAQTALNGDIMGCCWSPDGKQIAYTWREVHEGKPEEARDKEMEARVVVCDPDGKNAKTIALDKGRQEIITFTYVDWRLCPFEDAAASEKK